MNKEAKLINLLACSTVGNPPVVLVNGTRHFLVGYDSRTYPETPWEVLPAPFERRWITAYTFSSWVSEEIIELIEETPIVTAVTYDFLWGLGL